MSWPARKWLMGSRIEDIHDVIHRINVGATTMVSGKPMHPKVLENWSVATISGAVRHGRVHVALLNPHYVEPVKVEMPF